MLKSYYCITYNFKTRDDGRVIYLRLLLFAQNQNIHKCNSKIIIAISKEYDFVEYEMEYLSPSHLDKCGSEDKVTRYGYRFPFKSNPIKIALRHYQVDTKTAHPHFNFAEDTFNTLEEHEILVSTTKSSSEYLKAIEVVQKSTTDRQEYPMICLDNLEQYLLVNE